MPSRRTVLAAACILPIAGCIDSHEPATDDTRGDPTDTNDSPAADHTDAASPDIELDQDPDDATPEGVPESRGPERGRSETTLVVHVEEDDDDLEYLPEADEVRFVAFEPFDPDEKPTYDTIPFELKATIECASAAAAVAVEHVRTELDGNVGKYVSSKVGTDGERAAIMTINSTLGADGTVKYMPEIEFGELLAATPRSIQATYEFEGRTHETTVPVYAKREVIREL